MAVFFFGIFNAVLYLLLAGHASGCGHLSPTPLMAAYENYENHSRKRPAPVTDTSPRPEGVPLTRLRLYSCNGIIGRFFFNKII